jgi:hypothetical protein
VTKFDTEVFFSEATPMGLIPACWRIWHRCRTCYDWLRTDELLAHAQEHDAISAHETLEKGDTIG